MIKVTLGEAKLGLSSYLELLQSGEVAIICRNGEPIAELRAVAMPKQGEERHFGLWDGFWGFRELLRAIA
jgi:antitoxin (DNA-binding transcriptional repressor) of toxin-antitoxin stability system